MKTLPLGFSLLFLLSLRGEGTHHEGNAPPSPPKAAEGNANFENEKKADAGEIGAVHSVISRGFPKNSKYAAEAKNSFNNVYAGLPNRGEKAALAAVVPHMLREKRLDPEIFAALTRHLGPEKMTLVGRLAENIGRWQREASLGARFAAAPNERRGRESSSSWDADPAVLIYKAAEEAYPEDPAASESLADYASRNKNPAKTIEHATRAIERGSSHAQTRLLRGLAYDESGEYEAAHEDARKVLKRDPGNLKAQALYRLTRGRKAEAKLAGAGALLGRGGGGEAAREASALSAGVSAQGAATAGFDSGRPEPEAPAASQAEAKTRQAAQLLREAAQAARVGDKREAREKALRALTLAPARVEGYRMLSAVQASHGEYASARKVADDGLARFPDDVPLLLTRSFSLNRAGEFARARGDAAAALRFKPESALGRLYRANANAGLGRRQEALKDLAAAARLDAKYEAWSRRAAAMEEGEDLAALFDAMLGGEEAPAAAPAPASPRRPDVPYGLFALAGGVFIAVGLVHVLSSGRRRAGPGDADARPDTAFWRRYDVTRALAEGGMGIVYEAYDRTLRRKVAVKRMREELGGSPEEKERFLREARIVAGMRHPNIVEIYSIEEDGPDVYLVFEYVDGRTLDDILAEKSRLPLEQAVEVFRGVCSALEYAHGRGVIHRDLKPSNIMLNSGGVPKVMDFGAARLAEEPAAGESVETEAAGTPYYMAPEQQRGVVRPENDVYALGVCLYETLCGYRPFQGTPGGVLLSKRSGKYLSLETAMPGIAAGVVRVVDRALRPEPGERFRSPSEFFSALEASSRLPRRGVLP